MYYFEKGFNFSQDGPGNRVVWHLAGCNMRCPWCSNPEGMSRNSPKTKEITARQAAEDIISCKPMFFSGGGVTFTGGECTCQGKELAKLIKILKKNGVHTAIESNADTEIFPEIATLADFVMTDYKSPNAEKLKEVTGGRLDLIEKNLREAVKLKFLHIRIPLIHGFNDSDEDLSGFIGFFNSLSEISHDFDVEILPYHEYGKDKWAKLGLEYTVTDGYVSADTVRNFTNIMINSGIKIVKS